MKVQFKKSTGLDPKVLIDDKPQYNPKYVHYLEDKLRLIKSAIKLAENIVSDQSNGITDSQICISAMKDIRRHLK